MVVTELNGSDRFNTNNDKHRFVFGQSYLAPFKNIFFKQPKGNLTITELNGSVQHKTTGGKHRFVFGQTYIAPIGTFVEEAGPQTSEGERVSFF